MMAVRAGHEEATEALLEHDLDVDNALKEACRFGQSHLVHVLIDKGADPNINHSKVFHEAMAGGSAELVKALLEHDIDYTLTVAMADAMEAHRSQSSTCSEDFETKLSHLRRTCAKICAPDRWEGSDFDCNVGDQAR
jgi:hypothetical protein